MKALPAVYHIVSLFRHPARIFRRIKKTIKPAYAKFIFLSKGFSIRDIRTIDKNELLAFINKNCIFRNILDEVSFDDYLNNLKPHRHGLVVSIYSNIGALILLKGNTEKTLAIHTFFLTDRIKEKQIADYIFHYLLRFAKKIGYSELSFWVRKFPAGSPVRTNFLGTEEAVDYFYRQGFRNGYEIFNMILEKDNFKSSDVASLARNIANEEIAIRNYRKDDDNKILAFIDSEFPWWENRMQLVLNHCNCEISVMVAELNKEVIGLVHSFMGCDREFQLLKPSWSLKYLLHQEVADVGYLMTGAVKKAWQGQGIGAKLQCSSIERLFFRGASRIFVSTIAPGFLERDGFTVLARYEILLKQTGE